jgi:hypothetical protein
MSTRNPYLTDVSDEEWAFVVLFTGEKPQAAAAERGTK